MVEDVEREEEEEKCSDEPKPFCQDIQVLSLLVKTKMYFGYICQDHMAKDVKKINDLAGAVH